METICESQLTQNLLEVHPRGVTLAILQLATEIPLSCLRSICPSLTISVHLQAGHFYALE